MDKGTTDKKYNFVARAAVCYFLILLMFLSCVLRVAVIDSQGYDSVCNEQIEYKIKVRRIRGTIYDCNMLPLTNNKKCIIAAAVPTPEAVMAVVGKTTESEKENLLNKLRKNKPAVCEVSKNVNSEDVATTEFYKTEGGIDACHVIGYLDNSGHGAAGLEEAYDSLLYSDKYLCAVFETDGKGRTLGGIQPRFENKSSALSNGVVSTIDINMQKSASEAASVIKKGAVVVAQAKTGEIKVLLSLPQFDTSNISKYLNDENSPFINRALLPYSVGSVFKTCVAAAGLEKGESEYIFDCQGNTYIVDRYFKCHKAAGHGIVDLRQALAFSCNCFFYNYAALVGGETIYRAARIFNFGSSIKIADNIKSAAGSIPDVNSLNNPAHLANFSIGQGDLSASPVALLPLYMAVANGGKYFTPSLVKKTIKDGIITPYDKGNPTVCMSKSTADTLKSYLEDTIISGTAVSAAPKTVTAAGKTATAQTGRVDENGNKVNNSWFCGFFPADEPEYVAVILSEGGTTAETTAVFAQIADKITEISHNSA